jgi:hypothetical protein
MTKLKEERDDLTKRLNCLTDSSLADKVDKEPQQTILGDEISKVKEQIAQMASENDALQKKLTNLDDKYKNVLMESESQVQELQQAAEEEIAKYTLELESLMSEMQQVNINKATIESQKNDIDCLEEELKSAKLENDKILAELEELEEAYQKTEAQIEMLKISQRKVGEFLAESKSRYETLSREKGLLEHELAEYRSKTTNWSTCTDAGYHDHKFKSEVSAHECQTVGLDDTISKEDMGTQTDLTAQDKTVDTTEDSVILFDNDVDSQFRKSQIRLNNSKNTKCQTTPAQAEKDLEFHDDSRGHSLKKDKEVQGSPIASQKNLVNVCIGTEENLLEATKTTDDACQTEILVEATEVQTEQSLVFVEMQGVGVQVTTENFLTASTDNSEEGMMIKRNTSRNGQTDEQRKQDTTAHIVGNIIVPSQAAQVHMKEEENIPTHEDTPSEPKQETVIEIEDNTSGPMATFDETNDNKRPFLEERESLLRKIQELEALLESSQKRTKGHRIRGSGNASTHRPKKERQQTSSDDDSSSSNSSSETSSHSGNHARQLQNRILALEKIIAKSTMILEPIANEQVEYTKAHLKDIERANSILKESIKETQLLRKELRNIRSKGKEQQVQEMKQEIEHLKNSLHQSQQMLLEMEEENHRVLQQSIEALTVSEVSDTEDKKTQEPSNKGRVEESEMAPTEIKRVINISKSI